MGQYEKAVQDYDKALSLNPNYAMALYNRGIAYYDARQYDRAAADMNQAIKLNPNFGNVVNDRASALREARDYDRTLSPVAAPAAGFAPAAALRPVFASRREGDRIMQDPAPALRNEAANALALQTAN
jgi:tetratricopeptide (TPR) repeat protein